MRYAIPLAGLTLTGCQNATPDWSQVRSACEAYVKEKLVAPSTFKAVRATHAIVSLTKEQFFEASPLQKLGETGRETVSLMKAPGAHTVIIEYDAENSLGAPLRSREVCDFLMSDIDHGIYEDNDLLFTAKNRAQTENAKASLNALEGTTSPQMGCCMAEGVDHFGVITSAPIVKTEIQ